MFLTLWLDYWNSSYFGFNQAQLNHQMGVENTAALLLAEKKRRDHITSVLKSLDPFTL